MSHYDIIGDVHGNATELAKTLEKLGYRPGSSGAYRHPERTAVFVGDLVDRGDEQLAVFELVKAMVDAGSAQAVMGNHEFNAIAWATTHPETGEPLRPHTDSNRAQHQAFLEQLTEEQQAFWIEWFKTLPLWLDLGGIRVVHACWHPASMKVVQDATGSDRLTTVEHFVAATDKGSELYEAVEVLLKGPEISLPDHDMDPFFDHEAKKHRTDARVRWWDHSATTLPALAALGNARLENRDPYPTYEPREVHPKYLDYVYTDEVPLFYGHYCRKWEHLLDEWSNRTACVDFNAGGNRTVVAYRWSGELEIHWQNYVSHDPAVIAPTASD